MNNESDNRVRDALGLLVALVVLAAFAMVIVLKDGDLKEFSDFIILLVPAMLGGMMVSNSRQTRKNDEIHTDVQEVKKRVNGELDAKFRALHERLDLAEVPRGDVSVPGETE